MHYDLFQEYSERILGFLQKCPIASISTLSGNEGSPRVKDPGYLGTRFARSDAMQSIAVLNLVPPRSDYEQVITLSRAPLSSENKSESAVMAFTQTKEFEIIFETFSDTRKYANLRKNPMVSITTGFSPTHHITFQYEGVAKPMSSLERN